MTVLSREIPDRLVEIGSHTDDLRVNKMSIRYEDEDLCAEGLEKLEDYYTVLYTEKHLRELVPAGYSKATGMELICNHLGIERNDVYAFGDSANDLDMLRFAGCGIAMGNACQIAKETADYVTRSIDRDGIYMGLKEFHLI